MVDFNHYSKKAFLPEMFPAPEALISIYIKRKAKVFIRVK